MHYAFPIDEGFDAFGIANRPAGDIRFKTSSIELIIDEGFDAFGIANRPAGDIRFKTSSIAPQFLTHN